MITAWAILDSWMLPKSSRNSHSLPHISSQRQASRFKRWKTTATNHANKGIGMESRLWCLYRICSLDLPFFLLLDTSFLSMSSMGNQHNRNNWLLSDLFGNCLAKQLPSKPGASGNPMRVPTFTGILRAQKRYGFHWNSGRYRFAPRHDYRSSMKICYHLTMLGRSIDIFSLIPNVF